MNLRNLLYNIAKHIHPPKAICPMKNRNAGVYSFSVGSSGEMMEYLTNAFTAKREADCFPNQTKIDFSLFPFFMIDDASKKGRKKSGEKSNQL